MRPGQTPRDTTHDASGFTKQELLDASGLSSKTFDLIRKASRIRGPSHGGLNWVFSRQDVESLIHRAASGRFSERGGTAAQGWRRLLDPPV
ncbi:MAG: hypothetical protein KF787_12310 [Phycisphaeraceae bacterium]|nr:hypothetical protein [Phycisphaerae bacterium]MBX3393419.1 hypothetical protein [Phycisphaeraceae bacterium]HRJ48982.1 hypothetical protein [Phycisphaerales bacterium]